MALVVEIPPDENQENADPVGDDGLAENGEDEEEGGITRCICASLSLSCRADH